MAAPRQRTNNAHQFYEDWMDYKNRERRASSATTETIKSLKNGKYQLYDEYKARLSKTPSSTPTPPPQPVVSTSAKAKRQSLPIIQPIRERKSAKPEAIDWNNLSDEMKSKIEADFGPFYKWVINGRTDDLKKEIIEKLLFKTN
ncbi:hypothetical protein L5515_017484 [Caenorhabditis briggsae]|uniref:Uncharacterized protein n=1 Tax=Caenorhabditis briggsae TaxID=6238 RepID=A0AAE9FEC8_CAEBR|nr:hypothetical protein L3Y34_011605 [Caenorhabditis briggsae]UMM41051.1 hypothetical protein L5515_017484 [Caenorhabditis briggsae]